MNDYVDGSSPGVLDNLTTFTYSVWLKPITVGEGGTGSIVHKGEDITDGKSFRTIGTAAFGFNAACNTQNATAQAVANTSRLDEWNFVVVTYVSGSNPKLYKNASEVVYEAGRSECQGGEVSESNMNLYLGNSGFRATTFNGLIDDVKIYNRAL